MVVKRKKKIEIKPTEETEKQIEAMVKIAKELKPSPVVIPEKVSKPETPIIAEVEEKIEVAKTKKKKPFKPRTATGRVLDQILETKVKIKVDGEETVELQAGDEYLCFAGLQVSESLIKRIRGDPDSPNESQRMGFLGQFKEIPQDKLKALASAIAQRKGKKYIVEELDLEYELDIYKTIKDLSSELRVSRIVNELCVDKEALLKRMNGEEYKWVGTPEGQLTEFSVAFEKGPEALTQVIAESEAVQSDIEAKESAIKAFEEQLETLEKKEITIKEETFGREAEVLGERLLSEWQRLNVADRTRGLKGDFKAFLEKEDDPFFREAEEELVKSRRAAEQQYRREEKVGKRKKLTPEQAKEVEAIARKNPHFQELHTKAMRKWGKELPEKVEEFKTTVLAKDFPALYQLSEAQTSQKDKRATDKQKDLLERYKLIVDPKYRFPNLLKKFQTFSKSKAEAERFFDSFVKGAPEKTEKWYRAVVSPFSGEPRGISEENLPKRKDIETVSSIIDGLMEKQGLKPKKITARKLGKAREQLADNIEQIDLSKVSYSEVFRSLQQEAVAQVKR